MFIAWCPRIHIIISHMYLFYVVFRKLFGVCVDAFIANELNYDSKFN